MEITILAGVWFKSHLQNQFPLLHCISNNDVKMYINACMPFLSMNSVAKHVIYTWGSVTWEGCKGVVLFDLKMQWSEKCVFSRADRQNPDAETSL